MSRQPNQDLSCSKRRVFASLTREDQDTQSQQKTVQFPLYDPYTQTTKDFDIQISPLFNAPIFQSISITGPRPRILDLLHEPAPRPLSLHHTRRQGRRCSKGHVHLPWPQRGVVIVEKCERFCFSCGLEVQTAATLRKVSMRISQLDERETDVVLAYQRTA
jgi:hypothetical protein